QLINGSVVEPDETWSFNRTVGERTKANGFMESAGARGSQTSHVGEAAGSRTVSDVHGAGGRSRVT
ncbi:VanW family protein, partial [Streptomyces tibetensis]|uniref:VanW family protein n=1 Tax=Streptomyces tibetensis TaxID=2382123 RepID=UPI00340930C2